jgi:hypothetical protein
LTLERLALISARVKLPAIATGDSAEHQKELSMKKKGKKDDKGGKKGK